VEELADVADKTPTCDVYNARYHAAVELGVDDADGLKSLEMRTMYIVQRATSVSMQMGQKRIEALILKHVELRL
jgi:hypothetical protein